MFSPIFTLYTQNNAKNVQDILHAFCRYQEACAVWVQIPKQRFWNYYYYLTATVQEARKNIFTLYFISIIKLGSWTRLTSLWIWNIIIYWSCTCSAENNFIYNKVHFSYFCWGTGVVYFLSNSSENCSIFF